MGWTLLSVRHLQAILVIAEEGSFTGAAARLHVAQSAVSLQVKAMEDELGAALFVRERTGIRLTKAGEFAVSLARKVMDDLQQLDELRRIASTERMTLRIGCITGALGNWIPRVIALTRSHLPGVLLRLTEARTAPIVSLLQSGMIDVGIASTPHARTGLVATPLYEEGMMLLVRAASPWARCSAVTPGQVAGEPFILYPPGHALRQLVDAALARYGLQPSLALEAESSRILCQAVADGFGVAIVTENFARNHPAPELAYVPLKAKRLRRRVVVLRRPAQEEHEEALQTFLRCVREVLQAPGAVAGTVLVGAAPPTGASPRNNQAKEGDPTSPSDGR